MDYQAGKIGCKAIYRLNFMMKTSLYTKKQKIFGSCLSLIVLLMISSFAFIPNSKGIIRCYSKGNSVIKLYKASSGTGVWDSLPLFANKENCWYIIELSDSKHNRFKVKSITILPSCQELKLPQCEGMWVDKSNDLLIDCVYYDFENGEKMKLYLKPSLGSQSVLTDTFRHYNLTDFKNGWAKVKYYEGNTLKTGWMSPDDQCCSPWTECPKN